MSLKYVKGGALGMNSLSIDQETSTICVGGEDGMVLFYDSGHHKPLTSQLDLEYEIAAVSFPKQKKAKTFFVATVEQNTVSAYSFPDCQLQELIYRSTVGIKHLDSTEKWVAVAGEDIDCKIIDRQDHSQVITLAGHTEVGLSIAIAPNEKVVASSSKDGTVCIFEIDTVDQSAKVVHRIEKIFTTAAGETKSFNQFFQNNYLGKCEDDIILMRIAWEPTQGKFLAVPEGRDCIALYAKQATSQKWTRTSELRTLGNTSSKISSFVNVIGVSPNGIYIAAATLDKDVYVWDIASKEIVYNHQLDHAIVGLEWSFHENSFVLMTSEGKFCVVSDVIPKRMASPFSASDRKIPIEKTMASNFIDNEAEEAGDDGEVESTIIGEDERSVNAIKASLGFDENMVFVDMKDDTDRINDDEVEKIDSTNQSSTVVRNPPQLPFQPSSVFNEKGPYGLISILAWTPFGEIDSSAPSASENFVTIEFNDKSKRLIKFHDQYFFSMASMDENGAFFASPKRQKINLEDEGVSENVNENHSIPSFLFYRAFNSWANNSSWHLPLPTHEDATNVANGDIFCAVATTANLVRIYSTSGLEHSMIQLSGPVVTLTGRGCCLGIVYHDCASPQSNKLSFKLLKVSSTLFQLASGPFPLSPILPTGSILQQTTAQLNWLGFDDKMALFAIDSIGTVQVLSEGNAWNWTPVTRIFNKTSILYDTSLKSNENRIFPIGFLNNNLLYFPLEKNQKCPNLQRKQRPIPTVLNLMKQHFCHFQADPIRKTSANKINMLYSKVDICNQQRLQKLVDPSDVGNDVYPNIYEATNRLARIEETLLAEQVAYDKQLVLFAKKACLDDEPLRVYDLAKCLYMEKSFAIIVKLARHYGFRTLTQQLEELQGTKFQLEEEDDDVPSFTSSSYNDRISSQAQQIHSPVKQSRQKEHLDKSPSKRDDADVETAKENIRQSKKSSSPTVLVVNEAKRSLPRNPFLKTNAEKKKRIF